MGILRVSEKWLVRFYTNFSVRPSNTPTFRLTFSWKTKKFRCCLSFVPRAQLLKKSAWLLHQIGDKAPPTALDRSEIARTLNCHCYPHPENSEHRWCLSSSLSFIGRIFYPGRNHGCCPVRATWVPLPCGRHLLAPLTKNKEGSKSLMVLRVKPTLTRFPTKSLYTPMENTLLHSLSSVCHPWG